MATGCRCRRRRGPLIAAAAAAFLGLAPACLPADLLPPEPPLVCRANDDRPIPEPQELEEGNYIVWNGVDAMLFNQLEKALDAGFLGRKIGAWLRLAGPKEAGDVNAIDEVPDSTWFVNRHAWQRMSLEDLRRGPNVAGGGPDAGGPLTIVEGKSGLQPGFQVEDRKGDRYIVKLDPALYPKLGTATEMIASRFMYAAGYHVPEYYLIDIDPARLAIAPQATIRGRYNIERLMTPEDLREILALAARSPEDGTYRATASKFLPGKPKGPFPLVGVREDDPNDTVFHQDRRPLRGLRVVSAFLNNTDSRRGNYLDVYVGRNTTGHLVHYLLDFSACMGSGNINPKEPKYGHAYLVDPEDIVMSFFSLGFWIKPWERPAQVTFASAGSFRAEDFDPEEWKPSYANPMFQRMTDRDGFWAAVIVTSFSDRDIRAIVDTARYDEPETARYVVDVFIARRDRIGRTWLDASRINPLDRFEVRARPEGSDLRWRDLSVERGYNSSADTLYRYRLAAVIEGGRLTRRASSWSTSARPGIPLSRQDRLLHLTRMPGATYVIDIRTSCDAGAHWSPRLLVYVSETPAGALLVTGLRRDT
ncbi:MAG: hypothetical protein AB1640_06665 [bacterium]